MLEGTNCMVYGLFDVDEPDVIKYVGVSHLSPVQKIMHIRKELELGLTNVKTDWLKNIEFGLKVFQDRLNIYQATFLLRTKIEESPGLLNHQFKKYKPHAGLFKESVKRKPVEQYTLDGTFIKTHLSITHAQRELNVKSNGGISLCCQGKNRQAFGFIWKYAQ